MVSKNLFDKEIQSILDQLVKLYKPEKVILFGSVALGEIKQSSDIDFFIVKSDVPELGVDRIRQLDALIKYRLATDFIVYKPQELEQRLKMGDPFVENILKEGKLLYAAA
jgi:predicted nucleotidyltransferase